MSMRDFDEYLISKLQDPFQAKEYLDVAMEEYSEDNDAEALMLAIKAVTKAQGGIGELANKTNLNREHLYKVLSKSGNPRLDTFSTILHELGYRLSIESIDTEQTHT